MEFIFSFEIQKIMEFSIFGHLFFTYDFNDSFKN